MRVPEIRKQPQADANPSPSAEARRPFIQGVRHALAWWAICFSLIPLLPNLAGILATRNKPPSWLGPELDTRLIHAGLIRAPHFQDTLRWWTGPWIMGDFAPFYRPLTSELFWLEWKCFGDREWLYIFPTVACHALACVLLVRFVYRLADIYGIAKPGVAALTSAWLFAGLLGPISNRDGVANAVMLLWKNQPDSLAAACCFGALLCYLKAQEGDRSSLRWAVGLYLVACAFKEIAVPLPVICLCLEWRPQGKPVSPGGRQRIIAMLATTVIFLVIRRLAIGGFGYTYGQNREWLRRTFLELLGPFYPMATGEWLGNAIAFWIGLMFWWMARRQRVLSGQGEAGEQTGALRRKWAPVLAGVVTLVGIGIMGFASLPVANRGGWSDLLFSTGIVTGWMMVFQPVILETLVTSLLLMASITLLLPSFRTILILGLAWVAVFLAPLVVSGGPVHRFYVPQVGYILIYACAAAVAWEKLRAELLSKKQSRPD